MISSYKKEAAKPPFVIEVNPEVRPTIEVHPAKVCPTIYVEPAEQKIIVKPHKPCVWRFDIQYNHNGRPSTIIATPQEQE